MLRLSKLTDYGVVVMTFLAEAPDEVRAANEVAACTRVALPTVSKVLKLLSGTVYLGGGGHRRP